MNKLDRFLLRCNTVLRLRDNKLECFAGRHFQPSLMFVDACYFFAVSLKNKLVCLSPQNTCEHEESDSKN